MANDTTVDPDTGEISPIVEMTYRRSSSIAAIATALSAAQGKIEGATKGNVNPHFKSKYADLSSVWDACREPLSQEGIAVVQPPVAQGTLVTVTTMLLHKSGEWIESDLQMTAGQNTPQAIGSCITYARRYALAAMVGVAPEDDDGNAASQQPTNGGREASNVAQMAPQKYDDFLTDLTATADNGIAALMAAFNGASLDLRNHLVRKDNGRWEALKARAAKVKASA